MDSSILLGIGTILIGLLIHATVLGLWAGRWTARIVAIEKTGEYLKAEIEEKQTIIGCNNKIELLREKRKSDDRLLESVVHNQRILKKNQESLMKAVSDTQSILKERVINEKI